MVPQVAALTAAETGSSLFREDWKEWDAGLVRKEREEASLVLLDSEVVTHPVETQEVGEDTVRRETQDLRTRVAEVTGAEAMTHPVVMTDAEVMTHPAMMTDAEVMTHPAMMTG